MDGEFDDNVETDPLVSGKSKLPTSDLESLPPDAVAMRAVLNRAQSSSKAQTSTAVPGDKNEPEPVHQGKSSSTKPPKIFLVIPKTPEDSPDAPERQSGDVSSLKQRVVASPTMSPTIPPSPELTSPLWVQAPHQPVLKK